MRTGVEDRADTYPIRPEVLQARAQAFRESYARAEIQVGRVGTEQSTKRKEFDGDASARR